MVEETRKKPEKYKYYGDHHTSSVMLSNRRWEHNSKTPLSRLAVFISHDDDMSVNLVCSSLEKKETAIDWMQVIQKAKTIGKLRALES